MNPVYVQTIPLPDILRKLGLIPAEQNTTAILYRSPFHEHPTPSLQVSLADNRWQDSYTRNSGGSMELIQSWLLHQGLKCSEAEVLHWFRFQIGYPAMSKKFDLPESTASDQYKIAFRTALQERSLLRYVSEQGFSYEQAKRFFKQMYVLNKPTGKEFRALGMRNEEGGYALYSPHLEALTAPVSVSFIRGGKNDYERVYLFKTPFDYQQAVKFYPSIERHDSIILHAYGCADHAAAYIRGFGYKRLYTVFDDSPEGKRATKAFHWLCSTEVHLVHRSLHLDHS
ncbi:MAG TPA: hypothetical protein VL098_08460 [Flavipsychrobacter sp.]|nr:hypothetical protein [Flavipsychrobacter sp.]